MYHYAAYGLSIQSAFELPELPAVDGAPAPDVTIRDDAVEAVPRSVDAFGEFRVQAEPGVARLSYESVGTFLVESGERVTFDPVAADTLDDPTVRRLLEKEILGLALHQRDRLVLHASAVSVDGEAVLFLGEQGAGKSTTAAAFHQAGHDVLEDDMVVIRTDGEVPTVAPGVPQIRLEPDCADAIGIEQTDEFPDVEQVDKVLKRLDSTPDPAPLARCYVLRRDGPLAVSDLSLQDTFLELISQTFARGVLSDTNAADTHFEQCSDIVETTPFRELQYPETVSRLPSVVDRVTDEL
ncbi:hypothetical protein [Halosimplex salinum]|uniref:hypothetical protein n=1 Tax=Halosimplex salinum TaxID=1710538 RepID=UPI000F49F015|nr:hypothetical protein [Halosimplex salinum]